MKIYTYEPIPKVNLGYSQERIVEHLKEHGETTGSELYRLSSKKSKPLKQLLEKGIIEKDGKKYRLRKAVRCDRLRHERLLENRLNSNNRESVLQDNKLKELFTDYYDIEDVSMKVREKLLTVGIFLDIDDNESDILIVEGKSNGFITTGCSL